MIDPIDVPCCAREAQIAIDRQEAHLPASEAGPRPGKEPPDDPTPGDHGPDPDEPLT